MHETPLPHRRTELDDLGQPAGPPSALLSFERDARLFARRGGLLDRLGETLRTKQLLPDELYRPPVPADVAVRRGRLRVTEFLADGREVTRAVLQAGAFLRARAWEPAALPPEGDGRPPAPWRDLAYVVLMALDDAELWELPPGALDGADAPPR